jgi:type I restriction enzyme S subunit
MQIGEITEPRIDQAGPPPTGEFTYVDISSVDNGAKRIVEPKRLPAETAPSRARQRLRSGDVLVSMTRPNLNAVALVPPELDGAVGSTGFHVLRARDNVLPHWLYYGVQTRQFVGAMSELVQGALYPAVRPKDIRAFDLPVPELDEQRRIVAELERQFSRLDEAVANLKRVKANLKRYKAAVLKAAVEGRLVPTEAELAGCQRRSYETGGQLLERITATVSRSARAAKKSQPPGESGKEFPLELRAGWSAAPIAHLAEVVEYGSSAKTSEVDVGVPVLRMGNIVDGDLDLTTLKYLPASHEEFPRLLLRPGDLLFNRTNSPELVGKTAVFKGRPEKCSFASYLIRVRLASGCMPEFVSAFINSVHGRKWVMSVVTQQVGQANVNGTKLQDLLIPLPPIVEQERIVSELGRRLSIVGHIETCVDAELQQATILRHTALRSQFARFERQGSSAP